MVSYLKKIMSRNLEIETKALISEFDYLLLVNKYQEKRYVQINFYIDNQLRKFDDKLGLRIRYKDNQYELTLKEDYQDGKLEINQLISLDDFTSFSKENIFPEGEVKERLIQLNIDVSNLKIVGQLKTTRMDVKYKSSLISVDKSEYNGIIDYEVESEDSSREAANKHIAQFLLLNDIKFKENKVSKLERFKASLKR